MTDGFEFSSAGADGVARLRFARPAKRNAISYDMWTAIPGIVAEVEADAGTKVLLVSGCGGDFSAGADIAEFGELRATTSAAARYDAAVDAAVRALRELTKPSVAAINGNCIGGGCQLAVACDFRFARPDARLGITPAKLGIVYDFPSTRMLVNLIGPAHARQLLLSGDLISGDRAAEIGLVNETADDLDTRVAEFLTTLCSRSQTSVRGMNHIIGRILDGQVEADAEVARIRSEAVDGVDYAEGVAAFLSRRIPDFG